MKRAVFSLLIIITLNANAQSLKDALYGGKLKSNTGSVIRKTDDLSTKIDTSRKKVVEMEKNKLTGTAGDSTLNKMNNQKEETIISVADKMDNNSIVKDNNKLWKEFMDASIVTLKEEVLPSKKIKKDVYVIMVDYEIGLDGQVSITNVYPSPENKFLAEQVKERLSINAPRLNPVLSSNGKARKVAKRYNFTMTKT